MSSYNRTNRFSVYDEYQSYKMSSVAATENEECEWDRRNSVSKKRTGFWIYFVTNKKNILDVSSKCESACLSIFTDDLLRSLYNNGSEEWPVAICEHVKKICLKEKTKNVNEIRSKILYVIANIKGIKE
jgi:hypothetical protein